VARGAAMRRMRSGRAPRGVTRSTATASAVAVVLVSGLGCGRRAGSSAADAGSCAHAACGDHFFVDAVPPPACEAGAACRLTIKLATLGDFHVNDEYPYQFQADETPGIQFTGTGAAGQSVFSKTAGDWRKDDAKRGSMTVSFFPSTPGAHAFSGIFKLSVCSGATCLSEQRMVSASFAAE
jgi:hypothetical protein